MVEPGTMPLANGIPTTMPAPSMGPPGTIPPWSMGPPATMTPPSMGPPATMPPSSMRPPATMSPPSMSPGPWPPQSGVPPSMSYGYGAAVPQAPLSSSMAVPKASKRLSDPAPTDDESLLSKPRGRGATAQWVDVIAALVVLFVPVCFYTLIYVLLCFSPRYSLSFIAWAVVFVLLCIPIGFGYATYSLAVSPEDTREKRSLAAWSFGMFFGMLFAWMLAVENADADYLSNMQPFYARTQLNKYSGVDPSKSEGTSYMDAGIIEFVPSAFVDTAKSNAFKNGDMYCVAPIVAKNATSDASFDFWAVGTNCCAGVGDYHCDAFLDKGQVGLRLMSNSQQEFYKLAVAQSAGRFGIKAASPLFFHWVKDKDMGPKGASSLFRAVWHFASYQVVVTVATAIFVLWVKTGH